MKRIIRNFIVVLAMGILLTGAGAVVSNAKTIRIAPEVQKGKTKTIYTVKKKKGKTTLTRLTAKTSNKSVASVKVAKANGGKKYCVKVTGKRTGSAMVNVKVKKKMASGKIKTSTLWFSIDVWGNEKQKAQEAFELQNAERKKAGQKELEWSEELYKIAVIRVEKDGFDGHRNFDNRWDEHFSIDGVFLGSWGWENMCKGTSSPKKAIESWVNSSMHYRAMMRSDLQCGAIAFDDERAVWTSVFTSSSLSSIENWRTETPLLKVRRIDNTTGEEICGSVIRIIDDAGNEVYRTAVKKEKSNNYHIFELDTFIIGKTYKIIETSAPDGYKKADSVTFVARGASEGVIEIVLSSDKK